jgi:hypothetical protein
MEHSLVWVDEKASDFSHDAVKCSQQQTAVILRLAASFSSASNGNWGPETEDERFSRQWPRRFIIKSNFILIHQKALEIGHIGCSLFGRLHSL